jgi:hypothetical protein
MDPTTTMRLTPAALAASICARWLAQSATSGAWPALKRKRGRGAGERLSSLASRIGITLRFMICGTALVAMTRRSAPSSADASAAAPLASQRSPTKTSAPAARSGLALFSERTTPTPSNSAGRSKSFCIISLPVRPPAPVTTTRSFAASPAIAAAGACAAACMCSASAVKTGVAERALSGAGDERRP